MHVLQGLNLDIEPGEFVAFMGPSGSGKTTLLNLLGGLDLPTAGSVAVAGRRDHPHVGGKLTAWRARHVGFVFQMYNLIPVLTAFQNVELPLLLTTPLAVRAARARGNGPRHRGADRPRRAIFPASSPAAQEQRVAIARAMVSDPTFLLCDEPTGDLDRKSADEIMALIERLVDEHGKTVLMVTHDPRAAARAHVVLHLEKGALVESTPGPRSMKYLALILANLWRKKVRTTLTIGSFAAALFLFGLLIAVRGAFNQGVEVAGADRLIVINRVSAHPAPAPRLPRPDPRRFPG